MHGRTLVSSRANSPSTWKKNHTGAWPHGNDLRRWSRWRHLRTAPTVPGRCWASSRHHDRWWRSARSDDRSQARSHHHRDRSAGLPPARLRSDRPQDARLPEHAASGPLGRCLRAWPDCEHRSWRGRVSPQADALDRARRAGRAAPRVVDRLARGHARLIFFFSSSWSGPPGGTRPHLTRPPKKHF